ncbi:MAG: translation initiation factor IF-2 [Gemmataceae bacterium]
MTKEKVRVYALARELNMDSKDLLELCRANGLDLKNQLSSVDPDQRDMIEDLVKKGSSAPTPAKSVAPAPSAPVIPPVAGKVNKMRDLGGRRPTKGRPAADDDLPDTKPSPPTPPPAPQKEGIQEKVEPDTKRSVPAASPDEIPSKTTPAKADAPVKPAAPTAPEQPTTDSKPTPLGEEPPAPAPEKSAEKPISATLPQPEPEVSAEEPMQPTPEPAAVKGELNESAPAKTESPKPTASPEATTVAPVPDPIIEESPTNTENQPTPTVSAETNQAKDSSETKEPSPVTPKDSAPDKPATPPQAEGPESKPEKPVPPSTPATAGPPSSLYGNMGSGKMKDLSAKKISKKVRDLNSRSSEKETPRPKPAKKPSTPTPTPQSPPDMKPRVQQSNKAPAPSSGHNLTSPPASSKLGDKGKSAKKKEEPDKQKALVKLTPELMKEADELGIPYHEILKRKMKEIESGASVEAAPSERDSGRTSRKDDKDSKDKDKDKKKKKKGRDAKETSPQQGGQSALTDRELRRKKREERKKQRPGLGDEDEEELLRGSRGKGSKGRAKPQRPTILKPEGPAVLELPITVRSLSEALGQKAIPMLFKLKDLGIVGANINTNLEPELAEELALEFGREIEIKRPPDAEELLVSRFDEPDKEEELVSRAPVVTIMGHVDHGKTSLLDKIRETNVVDTEAGGITQVIRAWRVEHAGKPVTFLDTPGHEAFTAMRARGAQVTDIAVIVVAATDGVMPQTQEAINHAKAAGVSLVIAINKVDMPNANIDKTRQQLYSLDILPDDMGGDTPFVETSAATGQGIDELLENISVVAELKELKANPNKAAKGLCLEANQSSGEGVIATLLVEEGTLNRGDVILCGSAFGRIRMMYDDLGRPIEKAGPTVPVRITGLDEVPNADDPFIVAPDLSKAREIAEKRKERDQAASLAPTRTFDLSMLGQHEVDELKVILKADFRGSIEAITKELEKLDHPEVTVKVLHAAIGGISESDVQLALTAPENTMIVGFNAVPDDRAKQLAEEKGIPIREYNVIYMLTDDIKAALEGKLKPHQEIINLGRAVVRDTFKISRVGTVAGCYVTQGVLQRSGKIRLIRNGVVIYPPPDRTAGLDSLKRFKEDTGEVREGFECGLKIAGYDDIKVGDVIEAYRVEEVQRTLD